MIRLKSRDEVEKMRLSGAKLGTVLGYIGDMVEPGITTGDLNRAAELRIRELGAAPAFLHYMGYPAALCVSVNEEVIHGIPGRRVLKDGDVVSLDLGLIYEGYYADSAVTIACGDVAPDDAHLIDTTRDCLEAGIRAAVQGGRLGDIGSVVQGLAERNGMNVVREYVGHGIGRELHEDPEVPNYGKPGTGINLKEGLVIAIEPMVNAGSPVVRVLDDSWTVVTADGRHSAHFEHTIAITARGPLVLTQR
ncbi:MAG: type I methionyl aminopeptidase [Caldisericota bacterium]|jgi:methionyl aminopeptidase|nr:type I methionyl aminopeptidase [Caldisericota bacterium]